jgi:hypothetical protein
MNMRVEWTSPAHEPPKVHIQKSPGFPLVSWFLYDIDYPNSFNRHVLPFLSYLMVNVPCSEEGSALLWRTQLPDRASLLQYTVPTPLDNVAHTFHLMVVGHSTPVEVDSEARCLRKTGPENWDCEGFMKRYDMVRLQRQEGRAIGLREAEKSASC